MWTTALRFQPRLLLGVASLIVAPLVLALIFTLLATLATLNQENTGIAHDEDEDPRADQLASTWRGPPQDSGHHEDVK